MHDPRTRVSHLPVVDVRGTPGFRDRSPEGTSPATHVSYSPFLSGTSTPTSETDDAESSRPEGTPRDGGRRDSSSGLATPRRWNTSCTVWAGHTPRGAGVGTEAPRARVSDAHPGCLSFLPCMYRSGGPQISRGRETAVDELTSGVRYSSELWGGQDTSLRLRPGGCVSTDDECGPTEMGERLLPPEVEGAELVPSS